MPFVVDNSVVTGWWAISQATPYTDRVLAAARDDPPHAPGVWVLEFASVLRRARLERAVTDVMVRSVLAGIKALGIQVDWTALDPGELVPLSLRYGLTSYDAAYLELALRLEVPVACKDGPLASAAKRSGAGVFEPA